MSDASNGTSLREHLTLFARFLRSPRTVGAVSASSQVLARQLVDDLHFKHPVRVVELGPGTGALTGAIHDRLDTDDRFLAIDIDPLFVGRIRERWPDVDCTCASAEDLVRLAAERDMLPVDHVISALPFTSLPVDMSERILAAVVASLREGGTFTTFQYVSGYNFAPTRAFREKTTRQMGGPPSRRFIFRNLPPAWILTWQKNRL
jgi:phospholipid N-methyltransferase